MSEEIKEQEPVQPITEEEKEMAAVEKYAKTNPEKLPPEFKGDADKFIASYKELRKSYTKSQQELSTLKKKDLPVDEQPQQETETPLSTNKLEIPTPPETSQIPDEEAEKEWEALGYELQTTGNLSAATRQKIKSKYKIPDSIIDTHVDGWRQRALAVVNEAATIVGGNNELQKIIEWASNSLKPEERAAVNQQLASPTWKTTLMGLHARMSKETATPFDKEPKRPIPQTGNVVVKNEIEPFSTRGEMTAHIRDKRYGKDMNYTEWVQQRIRLSGNSKWG